MLTCFMFSAIFDDTKPQIQEPIVQCVQIKPLQPQQNQQERYRAVFSDISNYVQTMLAIRELIQSHQIPKVVETQLPARLIWRPRSKFSGH